jgi:hypothetical protein
MFLGHDPEKCEAISREDRTKQSAMMIDPASSRLAKRGIQVPESSTFHSFWKTWPEVSLASARNVLAPFDT